MKIPRRLLLGTALVVALVGCSSDTDSTKPRTSATPASTDSSSAGIQDVMGLEPFAPLETGTYSIDPDLDPSTPLRIVYDVADAGWSGWIGAVKFAQQGTACSPEGCVGGPAHVGVSITTVANLVRHGCRDHAWADPPIGPGVDDLVTALVHLAPFRVTSPPEDVTVDGYAGKHFELTVPHLPVSAEGDDLRFSKCEDGVLKSWVGAVDTAEEGDAFYGYTGPGYREEFWIVDVEGSRVVIAAGRSPGSSVEDLAELRAVVDSIRIELAGDP